MEAHTEELALFQKPIVDTGVERIDYIDYKPISQLGDGGGGLVEFIIKPQTSNAYIDLGRSKLEIKFKILHNAPDGKAVDFGPVNNFLYSLFSQVELSLNQQVISPDIGTSFSYKAYFDTLLNEGHPSSNSYQRLLQMFYMDTTDQMDNTNLDVKKRFNAGLVNREKFTHNSKECVVSGPLYVDLAQQEKLLLNSIEIGLRCWMQRTNWCLMSANRDVDFKVIVKDATLRLCTKRISPGVILGHSQALKSVPASYDYKRSVIKTFNLAEGQRSLSIDNLFNGKVPEELVIALTSSAGFTGNYQRNPFAFNNYNLNFLAFYIDGVSSPARPFQPSYGDSVENSQFVREYASLFKNKASDALIPISKRDFLHGYCIYRLDLTNTDSDEAKPNKREGHTRLDISFNSALHESVTLILYGKFGDKVEIDESRNIILK